MFHYVNPLDEFRATFRRPSALTYLIYINAGIYLLVSLVNVVLWLAAVHKPDLSGQKISWPLYYLSIPADLNQLLDRPWTIVTYMFMHSSIFHLIFNMLVLYFGGKIFLEYLSGRKLVIVYFLGGISGAFFFIAAYNFFPVFKNSISTALAVGASASVLAILFAAATYAPQYILHLFIFGRIRLKYLVLIIILIDILSIPGGNAGGHIAHLGGAFWGSMYVFLLKKGKGLNFLPRAGWLTGIRIPKRRRKSQYTPSGGRPLSDEEYNARKREHQEKIDRILEKIARSGYDSLTREEKEFLFRSSTKNQH